MPAALALLFGLFTLVGLPIATACSRPAPPAPSPRARPAPAAAHVIVVSLDGLRADAFPALLAATPERARTFGRLRAEGAFTLDARPVPERSVTMPNHACMLTGRPVSGDDGHGYWENGDQGETLHDNAGRYVPSLFDVAHDHGRSTALFASKEKFELFARSYDARRGAPDRMGEDDGRHKLDRARCSVEDRVTVDAVVEALALAPPALTFVHLARTDATGHGVGFDVTPGSPYLDAVGAMDEALGRLLGAIEGSPELRGKTALIVTTDHGGAGTRHHDNDAPENFTIPLMVWGPGIAAADLYALNPERRAPGGGRREPVEGEPIRNCDVANLALDLLGLPAVPGSRFGASQPLRVRASGPAAAPSRDGGGPDPYDW
jgi:predicted AlkP superfamily pyrophosphatase or phosphodiesterase